MGLAVDALTVAVGAGGALTTLAAAIRAWAGQPKRSAVRIALTTSGGSLEIEADRVTAADLERIIAATRPDRSP